MRQLSARRRRIEIWIGAIVGCALGHLISHTCFAVDNASIGNLKASGTIQAGGTGEFVGNITITNGTLVISGTNLDTYIPNKQSSNAAWAASAGIAATATSSTYSAVANVSTTATYAAVANVSTTTTYAAMANISSQLVANGYAQGNWYMTNGNLYVSNPAGSALIITNGVPLAAGGSGTPGAGTITTQMMTGAAHDAYIPYFCSMGPTGRTYISGLALTDFGYTNAQNYAGADGPNRRILITATGTWKFRMSLYGAGAGSQQYIYPVYSLDGSSEVTNIATCTSLGDARWYVSWESPPIVFSGTSGYFLGKQSLGGTTPSYAGTYDANGQQNSCYISAERISP